MQLSNYSKYTNMQNIPRRYLLTMRELMCQNINRFEVWINVWIFLRRRGEKNTNKMLKTDQFLHQTSDRFFFLPLHPISKGGRWCSPVPITYSSIFIKSIIQYCLFYSIIHPFPFSFPWNHTISGLLPKPLWWPPNLSFCLYYLFSIIYHEASRTNSSSTALTR